MYREIEMAVKKLEFGIVQRDPAEEHAGLWALT